MSARVATPPTCGKGSNQGHDPAVEDAASAADAPVIPDDQTLPYQPERIRDHPDSPLHADGIPRGDHGYVGTIDPDTAPRPQFDPIDGRPLDDPAPYLDADGNPTEPLTLNGRLRDPDAIPPAIQELLDRNPPPVRVDPDGVIRLNTDIELTFTRNPDHDPAEFNRQLDLQEQSLNQQTVQDWTNRREAYDVRRDTTGDGRWDDTATRPERTRLLRAEAERVIAQRVANGELPTPAHQRAALRQEMRDLRQLFKRDGEYPQAVLHGPDQVAGGNPHQFTGLGDSNVNSSLGAQWGKETGNAADLADQMDLQLEALGIPSHLLWDIRMNVRLVPAT